MLPAREGGRWPPHARAARAQVDVQAMINEKKAQLDRLTAQCDSLARVDAEQKALLERLTTHAS